MAITLDGTSGITTPDITSSGALSVDASAPDNSLVVDSSGNVGIGTSSPARPLHVSVSGSGAQGVARFESKDGATSHYLAINVDDTDNLVEFRSTGTSSGGYTFYTGNSERARITYDGYFIVGGTSYGGSSSSGSGGGFSQAGICWAAVDSTTVAIFNRQGNDGQVVHIRQNGTTEGTISVSGSTVSYNGGHLSRWSQLADNTRDETILKGTVMTNLDQMAEWTTDGVTEDNEQLNCMAVSSVEGDPNVAGVFVNWDNDDDVYTNDMNIAMTGDMIIRIAAGTTVARGDLLMSAGDGTAKPQGDDIVRSKTIAKVTSTHVTCTYDDGSYCVPCVLMAC